ncbi:hypothetical protein [Herbidospora cretacea]|uniref:hypothetical protein n=1 Tax=Herbidospora cretacea TaxID=28444 RepID=UPI000773CC46|nr:hypothetical protein [Herbidospora cretacea]
MFNWFKRDKKAEPAPELEGLGTDSGVSSERWAAMAAGVGARGYEVTTPASAPVDEVYDQEKDEPAEEPVPVVDDGKTVIEVPAGLDRELFGLVDPETGDVRTYYALSHLKSAATHLGGIANFEVWEGVTIWTRVEVPGAINPPDGAVYIAELYSTEPVNA